MVGVHQKTDRVARRYIHVLMPKKYFPTAAEIVHFEGINGPDGLKRKSPAQDEPWHYIDPTDPNDTQLVDMIKDHTHNLAQALKSKNRERAAFEAAWLAHAVVDGLTPAHHYPLEEKLEQLRGGEGLETRTSLKQKLVLPGVTRRHQLQNNWEFWGAKGIMTTHGLFEWGIATTITPMRFNKLRPNNNELVRVRSEGITPLFQEAMDRIYELKMYDTFRKSGWNQKLARQTRDELLPTIVHTVTLAWYAAAYAAYEAKK
jgi:hypothetical protein